MILISCVIIWVIFGFIISTNWVDRNPEPEDNLIHSLTFIMIGGPIIWILVLIGYIIGSIRKGK